jgi:hypothetical protein
VTCSISGAFLIKTKREGFAFRVFERSGGVKCEPNRHLILLWRGITSSPSTLLNNPEDKSRTGRGESEKKGQNPLK